MNGKFFVGGNAISFSRCETPLPVSKVVLWVDDENCYEAGTDDGTVLEVDCPYATQDMASALLSSMKGYQYRPGEIEGSNLSPLAELGDGVTVGGEYIPLIRQYITLGNTPVSDFSAPLTKEIDHEYQYTSPIQRQIERNMAKTRSLITKTSEEIMLKVEGIDGKYTEVKTTLDGLTVTDQSGTTRIKGSSIETESIAANSISADKLNLTGAITFGDLDANAQNSINTANNNASTAIAAAGNAQAAANGAVQKVSAWEYPGSTYIDGSKIMTGTVMATKLLGGTVGLLASDESIVGALNLAYTTTGIGLGILTSQGGIQIQSAGNLFLSAGTGGNITVQSGRVQLGSAVLCLASGNFGPGAPSGAGVDGQVYIQLVN